jgi:hypothetical protein
MRILNSVSKQVITWLIIVIDIERNPHQMLFYPNVLIYAIILPPNYCPILSKCMHFEIRNVFFRWIEVDNLQMRSF